MASYTLPYEFVTEIAPGADPSGDPSVWQWTTQGVRRREKTPVVISTGRDDEESTTTPGSCTVTCDIRDGNLSPRNILGVHYGKLARNTPLRHSFVAMNETFDRVQPAGGWGVEPKSGRTWLHSSSSVFSVNGADGLVALPSANTAGYAVVEGPLGYDFEQRTTVSLSAVMTGAAWAHVHIHRRVDNNNHYRLHAEFGTDGTIKYKILKIVNGVSTDLVPLGSTGIPYSAGTKINVLTRSLGPLLRLRIWLDGTAEPTTWTAVASDSEIDGTRGGMYEWRVSGNTNPGTVTLTVSRYRAQTDLHTGNIPEFPVTWPERAGRDALAPVTSAGILRRLGQGAPQVRSPLYSTLLSYAPWNFIPLEDASGATRAATAVSGKRAGVVGDATFGNDDAPLGAATSVSLNTIGPSFAGAAAQQPAGTNGHSSMWLFRLPTAPVGEVTLAEVSTDGVATYWYIRVTTTNFVVRALNADGTEIIALAAAHSMDLSSWIAMNFRCTVSGTTVTWTLEWIKAAYITAGYYSMSGTYTSSIARLASVTLVAPVAGTLVSSLWMGPASFPFSSGAVLAAMLGYAGETDIDRIRRIAAANNITVTVTGAVGVPLGPQPIATVLEIFRDAEAAGLGVLYERGPTLGYLARDARENPPVAMALDWDFGDMAVGPEPTDDDQRLRNRWTVEREGGSSSTISDSADIAKHGLYEDSRTLNLLMDQQTDEYASWFVALGTVNALRWPRIVLDLVAQPDLIKFWLGCRIGSRITIANPPSQIAGEEIDLIIEGYTQTLNKHTWRVELNCSPAAIWRQVAVADGATGNIDSLTSTTAGSFSATATTFTIRTVNPGETWDTLGDYDLRIAGEIIGVPLNGMGGVTGTGPYSQIVTGAVRGKGGYAKAHAAGEQVSVATPVVTSI